MSNRDHVRLQHMLDAAQAAVAHLLDKKREDLDHNRLLLNGVVGELEILGEAASQVSLSFRKEGTCSYPCSDGGQVTDR